MKYSSVFFALSLLPFISGKSVELRRRRRFLGAGPWSLFPHSIQPLGADPMFQGFDPYASQGATIQSNLFGGTYGPGGLGFFKPQTFNPFLAQQQAFNPFVAKPFGQDGMGFSHFNPSVMAMDVPKLRPPSLDMAVDVPLIKMPFGSAGTPWWKGPNICVEKYERDGKDSPSDNTSGNDSISDNTRQFSQCYTTETSHVCITRMKTNDIDKIYTVKRQCCHGFKRRSDGKPGCEELDLKDLVQTMKDLGTTTFLDISSKFNLTKKLRTDNFTVFIPTNDAFEKYKELRKNKGARNNRVEYTADLSEVLASHLTAGNFRSGDFSNNMLLPPLSNYTGIRTNIYFIPDKLITANCVPLLSINNYARNGVIHVVNKVLPIPSRTVADIISGDPQFTILKGIISKAGLVQKLRNADGNFTVFAPTDSAMSQDEVLLHRLQSGESCALNIVRGLILPTVVCSSAIPSHAQTINILGKYVTLSRTEENKLYINGKQVVGRDIIGTNGVVHIIDGVPVSDDAKLVTELLEERSLSDFSELIQMTGLTSTINTMKNFTLFAPTNEALQDLLPVMKKNLLENQTDLHNVVLSHIAEMPLEMRSIFKNQLVKSAVTNRTLRLHRYGAFPNVDGFVTAQCARVIDADYYTCGGVLHIIDKMLFVPKTNVIEALEDIDRFSILLQLLKETGLDERLRSSVGPYTMLAPMDDAFRQMPSTTLQRLFNDKTAAENLIMMHILPDFLCCAEVTTDVFLRRAQVRTLDNTLIDAYRTSRGWIKFGDARVLQCDIVTENGVIHVINKVLQQPQYDFFSYPISGPLFTVF